MSLIFRVQNTILWYTVRFFCSSRDIPHAQKVFSLLPVIG